MQKYQRKPEEHKELAQKAIEKYFSMAEKMFKEDGKLSDKYVKDARKTAMKFKVRIPTKYKRRMCKKCLSYLVPGVNCRIRVHKKNVITYCFNCKNIMKFGYK
jgi:ribonuclease P protein subunit RPR2